MKLGTILTATDLNPLYADFIPTFVAAWKKLVPEADICIVMVADSIPPQFDAYREHIKLFSPVPGIHTAFQAQCIRLLAPRDIQRDEAVLITDMDILPMSRRYYVDTISGTPSDAFVVYREVLMPEQIAMCYCAAHPSTWSSMFGAEPTADILRRWYSPDYTLYKSGWYTDQIQLVTAYNAWTGKKIVMRDCDTGFRRLNRSSNVKSICNFAVIAAERYTDYHALRPNTTYREFNDKVVAHLPTYKI
jgi:hypothetical protein